MITASESSAIKILQGKGDISVMSVSFSGYYLMEFHCIIWKINMEWLKFSSLFYLFLNDINLWFP